MKTKKQTPEKPKPKEEAPAVTRDQFFQDLRKATRRTEPNKRSR